MTSKLKPLWVKPHPPNHQITFGELRRPTELRLIVIRAGLNETITFASCVICNWLSFLMSSKLRGMCAPSHLRSSHLRSSYPISAQLHHFCASSYLRSWSQIFTYALSSSGLHILKPRLVFTSSDLHHVVALSYLIIFKISLCNYYCNFTSWYIYVFKTSFISPRSGQPWSSVHIHTAIESVRSSQLIPCHVLRWLKNHYFKYLRLAEQPAVLSALTLGP